MPNKHTALLPDGTVAKRTSQNRTYPYVIAVRESYEHALKQARAYGDYDVHRSNWKYAREQVEQGDAHRHAAYNTPAKKAENERVAAMTLEEYRADLTAQAIAAVEERKAKGAFDKWGALTWTSRTDLANKAHQQAAGNPMWAEVRTLETMIA
jgi:hypothetical protein